MKSIITLFVLATSPAFAQVTLDVSPSFKSQYVVSPGIVVHNEPVAQTDLLLSLPLGFSVDLWGSTDFHGDANGGREIDYGLGWANKLLSVWVYYYDLSGLFSQKKFGDIVAASGEIGKSLPISGQQSVRPFAKFEYNHATKDPGDNSGTLTHVGLGHSWNISQKMAIGHNARLLYDSSIFGSDKGIMFSYGFAASYQLTRAITVRPVTLKITAPVAGIHDRGFEPVLGMEMSIRFTLAE